MPHTHRYRQNWYKQFVQPLLYFQFVAYLVPLPFVPESLFDHVLQENGALQGDTAVSSGGAVQFAAPVPLPAALRLSWPTASVALGCLDGAGSGTPPLLGSLTEGTQFGFRRSRRLAVSSPFSASGPCGGAFRSCHFGRLPTGRLSRSRAFGWNQLVH